MAINCSNNAALEKLQAAKDALNAQLDGLASAGTAGLAALESALSQFENDLKAALPKIPELPNFKKQLDALKGLNPIDLAAAKAKLKETWGDSLPDIDIDALADAVSLPSLDGLPSFDFCKDVPNIEGTVDTRTGKIATVKDKGAEPTTATEPAKAVEAVKPTVVDASKEPSKTHPKGKSFTELYEALNPYREQILEDLKPTAKIINTNNKKLSRLKKSRSYKKMLKRYQEAKKKGEITTGAEYYNTVASDSDKSALEKSFEYHTALREASAKHKAYKYVEALYYTRVEDNDEAGSKDTFLNNYTSNWKKIVVENGKASITMETVDNQPIYDLYIKNYTTNKEAVLNYWLYR